MKRRLIGCAACILLFVMGCSSNPKDLPCLVQRWYTTDAIPPDGRYPAQKLNDLGRAAGVAFVFVEVRIPGKHANLLPAELVDRPGKLTFFGETLPLEYERMLTLLAPDEKPPVGSLSTARPPRKDQTMVLAAYSRPTNRPPADAGKLSTRYGKPPPVPLSAGDRKQ